MIINKSNCNLQQMYFFLKQNSVEFQHQLFNNHQLYHENNYWFISIAQNVSYQCIPFLSERRIGLPLIVCFQFYTIYTQLHSNQIRMLPFKSVKPSKRSQEWRRVLEREILQLILSWLDWEKKKKKISGLLKVFTCTTRVCKHFTHSQLKCGEQNK